MRVSGGQARALAAELRRELAALRRLLPEVDSALESLVDTEKPASSLVVRGCAGLLHDFYTGTEKLFVCIATGVDGGLPTGPRWHRRLLDSMACALEGYRPAAVGGEVHKQLEEYLRFRHLFRNVYGYSLDLVRLLPLLKQTRPTFEQLCSDLEPLLTLLDTLARG